MAPFGLAEIKAAASCLEKNSASAPDGLGPGFYQAIWEAVVDDVALLFDGSHGEAVNLDSINCALVILLHKGEGTPSPSTFRPVSLQNADVKILCRGLASRLQRQICRIVDEDQSGFITG